MTTHAVSRFCKSAGIEGYKTNLSLRITTATRLFQAGVDEQLITERTGHHSTDGICTYKRSSVRQQEQISDILSLSRKPRVESSQSIAVSSQALMSGAVQETSDSTCIVDCVQAQSNKQLVYNSKSLHCMFNYEGCSNININVAFSGLQTVLASYISHLSILLYYISWGIFSLPEGYKGKYDPYFPPSGNQSDQSVIVLLHTSNHTITPSAFVCATVLLLLHTLQYYSSY